MYLNEKGCVSVAITGAITGAAGRGLVGEAVLVSPNECDELETRLGVVLRLSAGGSMSLEPRARQASSLTDPFKCSEARLAGALADGH